MFMEKVAILVDAQNIYYTTKQAYNCSFDYNEFWEKATLNHCCPVNFHSNAI